MGLVPYKKKKKKKKNEEKKTRVISFSHMRI